jgi:signal transduction histidine kinase/CheY-like chemotaxis protein
MNQRSMSFYTEIRLEPGKVLIFFALLGFIFFGISQLLNLPTRIDEGASWLAVTAMGLAFIGWAYAVDRPQVARWLATLSSSFLLLVATWAFGESSILVLAPLPVLLASNMIGRSAVLPVALGQTLVLVLLMPVVLSEGPARASALVGISGVWMTTVLVWYEQNRLRKLMEWMGWHYARSERHLAEAREQREQAARTTSSLVKANRQLALANERTAVLRGAAEEAHQAKAIFVANVSHEFRTPLNMIIGLVQLMVESPEIYASIISPKMRRDLETVYRNCLHLAGMVDDVLDLTRTEAGSVTLRRERVDVADLIRKAADIVRPLLEEKSLSLGLVVPRDMPKVYCDQTRIQQVILNLLSNAARFTDEGGIEVSTQHDAGSVVVSVSDTGPGIAETELERVFEPFWQSTASARRRSGGTGLGLSISREFVQLHGGRMWVESKLSEGTTFRFSLPTSRPAGPVGRPGHSIRDDWVWREEGFRAAADVASEELVRPRVVVLDLTQGLGCEHLRYDERVETVITQRWEGVAEALADVPADLLVVHAPSLQELSREITRATAVAGDLPTVGYVTKPAPRRDLETYTHGYMVKPVMREDLLAAIRSAGQMPREMLLVDDDVDVLDLVSSQIESEYPSLGIDRAVCGQEALSYLEHGHYDLMLLDIVMPGLDGWQVLERAVGEGWLEDTVVYILSAQDPVEQEAASDLAVLANTHKPVPLGRSLDLALELLSAWDRRHKR